jgi:hypothetical protein
MPGFCIGDFYSYDKSPYSTGSTFSPSYSTSTYNNNFIETSKYETDMQKYLFLATLCSSTGVSCSGYSNNNGNGNGSRTMDRTNIISIPSELTNKGIY